MNIFREIPPTAGFPVSAKEFLQKGSLEEDFKDFLGADFAGITCSGTAGLYLICENLKNLLKNRTAVIIPAYICPSVPWAIAKAGLKVRVCDINRQDFNFNLGELEDLCRKNEDILAIVATHLAGIPVDLDPVAAIAKKHGIFLVEDCAQSLGAFYKGKKAGTLSDFSFFSLARGKGLTIYEGGAVVCNKKEYSAGLQQKIEQIVKDRPLAELLKILELLGYGVFYRPQLFWFVSKLPELFWTLRDEELRAQLEYFSRDFPVQNVSGFRKSVGHACFPRLEAEINSQRQKAFEYMEGLKDVQGVTVLKEATGDRATYPFVTLIFDEEGRRNKTLKILGSSGLGVSELYMSAIIDYPSLKDVVPAADCPGARYLASRQATLSTSTFLRKRDLDLILKDLRSY